MTEDTGSDGNRTADSFVSRATHSSPFPILARVKDSRTPEWTAPISTGSIGSMAQWVHVANSGPMVGAEKWDMNSYMMQ